MSSAAPVVRAYCYPSGLIEFGRTLPKGATIIARGPKDLLREFIESRARRHTPTRSWRGRRVKTPPREMLLVPGVPEAESQPQAAKALQDWSQWIATQAPKGVRVLAR